MNKILINIFIFFFLTINQVMSQENIMILKLKDGDVKIELFEDVAPNHVKRIKDLANSGKYDNVVFHRVIDGFMAQTGDVKFGNSSSSDFNLRMAGMGGSYTVFGKVIEGMEFVDKIKRGDENNNGAVTDPDKIISFKSL